ncbi:MAG: hypothetical protein Q7T04_04915 [Dehalococcoidia bacterium]|nr:hypothetical protein [Dehalococcoidia bacterium]
MDVTNSCKCKGIGLIHEMLETLLMQGLAAGDKKALIVAQKIQTHLKEQAMKKGNEEIYQKALESLEMLHNRTAVYHGGDDSPVTYLAGIKSQIRKSPELKQLMVGGADEAKKLERVFALASSEIEMPWGETSEIKDALKELDKIAKSLDC